MYFDFLKVSMAAGEVEDAVMRIFWEVDTL